MSTVTTLANVIMERGGWAALGQKAGLIQNEIDFAAAQTAKGSDLAAGDIIEALKIPKGTVVEWAAIQVVLATAGVTVMTLDLGVTGGDPDGWVDGFDVFAAVADDYAALAAAAAAVIITPAAGDTIDVLIKTLTTTLTAGKIRVIAKLADTNDLLL